MGEFFKPWRRKIGVVILAMACFLAVGWVRSQTRSEVISINFRAMYAIVIRSHPSGLLIFYTWRRHVCGLAIEPYDPDLWLQWNETLLDDAERKEFMPYISFTAGRSHWTSAPIYRGFRLLEAAYWSVVIPPTILAAYLLLSKPRTKKPPTKST